jgi:hypothetical protein
MALDHLEEGPVGAIERPREDVVEIADGLVVVNGPEKVDHAFKMQKIAQKAT